MLSRAACTARAARCLLQGARQGDALQSRSNGIAAASTAEPRKRRAIDPSSALPAATAAAPQLALDDGTAAAVAAAPPGTENTAAVENTAATATATTSSTTSLDEHFMRLALGQARAAALRGEVPVGALLVSRDGRSVLAAAGNGVEGLGDATAHAELLCLQRAAREGGACSSPSPSPSPPLLPSSSSSSAASAATTPWPRSATAGSTLYVTLEPCAMCAGAALLARVGRIVYGARNAGAGADGSWVSLLPREGSEGGEERGREEGDGGGAGDGGDGDAFSYPSLLPSRPHPSHPALEVTRGVLAPECGGLLKDFFRRRRAEGTRGAGNGVEKVVGSGGV